MSMNDCPGNGTVAVDRFDVLDLVRFHQPNLVGIDGVDFQAIVDVMEIVGVDRKRPIEEQFSLGPGFGFAGAFGDDENIGV